MRPDSITINYKTKHFTLERVNAEDRYFQIGFEAPRWGVRIYRLEGKRVRIIIEKSRARKDGGTNIQFLWDCYCLPFRGELHMYDICDPATCKHINRQTRWYLIGPMLDEIYRQLKAEIDALLSDGA